MYNPTVADALLVLAIHSAHRLELVGESQRKNPLVQTEVRNQGKRRAVQVGRITPKQVDRPKICMEHVSREIPTN